MSKLPIWPHGQRQVGILALAATALLLSGCGRAAQFVPGTDEWEQRKLVACLGERGVDAEVSDDGQQVSWTEGANMSGFESNSGDPDVGLERAMDDCL